MDIKNARKWSAQCQPREGLTRMNI